VWYFFVPKRL
jgi:hypothetical protein